jgi:hypothetical protein
MNHEENPAPESPDMRSSNSAESNAALFTRLIDHHIRFTVAKRRIQLSHHDWYRVTALAVRDMLVEQMLETRARFERAGAKKVFYLSVEYMIGRSLENNLFNLGIIDACRECLAENGIDLRALFEEEPDAGLGMSSRFARDPRHPRVCLRDQLRVRIVPPGNSRWLPAGASR